MKSSDPENDVAPQVRGAALPGQRLPAGQKLIMLLQNAKPKNFQAVRLPLKHFFTRLSLVFHLRVVDTKKTNSVKYKIKVITRPWVFNSGNIPSRDLKYA